MIVISLNMYFDLSEICVFYLNTREVTELLSTYHPQEMQQHREWAAGFLSLM